MFGFTAAKIATIYIPATHKDDEIRLSPLIPS